MTYVDQLIDVYRAHVALPWRSNLPHAQRVWCVVHPPPRESAVRARLADFAAATHAAGHGWRELDLTHWFGEWLATEEYRDAYFANPATITPALSLCHTALVDRLTNELSRAGEGDVVAMHGASGLFGVTRLSRLIEAAQPGVRGRLLVFFPGSYQAGVYQFLDARDGWNYHAVPLVADDSETA